MFDRNPSSGISYDCSGFTLLEVMIAVAILAVALIVLYGSQSRGLSYATEAGFYTTATSLAGMKLAELQCGTVEPLQETGDFGAQFPGFGWRIKIEEILLHEIVDSAPSWTRLRRIDLLIERKGSPHRYTLRYYKAAGLE
jgi:general secretion pathway protein I